MSKKKYAIYGMYSFETTCDDSPRGSYGPSESILVKLTHEDAMDMGKWFKEEKPYMMEYDHSMDYIDRVRKKMVREDGYSEEESWQFQVVWSDSLMYDCIQYYNDCMLKPLRSKKYEVYGVGYHGETGDDCWVKFKLTFDQIYAFGKRYANVKDISPVSIDYGCKEEVAVIINSLLNPDVYDYECYYPEELIEQARDLYLAAKPFME